MIGIFDNAIKHEGWFDWTLEPINNKNYGIR